jgi:hypothetical protein
MVSKLVSGTDEFDILFFFISPVQLNPGNLLGPRVAQDGASSSMDNILPTLVTGINEFDIIYLQSTLE